MKKIRTIVAMILVCAMLCGNDAVAYTTTTSGSNTIRPTSSDFRSAESPVYIKQFQTISGSISKKYEMDIYHYECQISGYYQIYTTGSLDTVGAVYEQNGVLSITYDKLAFNDIGRITQSADNFSTVVYLDKGEDYYICVRGYGSKTGSYSLRIEHNQDTTWWSTTGTWTKTVNKKGVVGTKPYMRTYISKEQAILCAWAMDPYCKLEVKSYTIRDIVDLSQTNMGMAVDLATTMLITYAGIVNVTAGLVMTALDMLLDHWLSASKSNRELFEEALVNKCGVGFEPAGSGALTIWTADNGMVIQENRTVLGSSKYIFSSYDETKGNAMKGVQGYCGKWTY